MGIFLRLGSFFLHKLGYRFIARNVGRHFYAEIPLISDKVVLENVHNLFFGHIGSFRFSCEGIPL